MSDVSDETPSAITPAFLAGVIALVKSHTLWHSTLGVRMEGWMIEIEEKNVLGVLSLWTPKTAEEIKKELQKKADIPEGCALGDISIVHLQSVLDRLVSRGWVSVRESAVDAYRVAPTEASRVRQLLGDRLADIVG